MTELICTDSSIFVGANTQSRGPCHDGTTGYVWNLNSTHLILMSSCRALSLLFSSTRILYVRIQHSRSPCSVRLKWRIFLFVHCCDSTGSFDSLNTQQKIHSAAGAGAGAGGAAAHMLRAGVSHG